MNSTPAITRPNYMEKFRCIGGACEDSCCAGWRVVFDKRTAQSYLDAKDPDIREIANKSIKKIKNDRSSQNHSFIQMNPQTGACPFLQADKLCMIQGKMGENALSKVCTTYPRHAGDVSGREIEVATLSCPEAARLCLLDPQAMKLEENKISSAGQLSLAAETPTLSPIRYLHQTAVEMLEDDRVSITEFVLVYGSALNMLRKRPEQAFAVERRFNEMQGIAGVIRKSISDQVTNVLQSQAVLQFQIGKVLPILVRHAKNHLTNKRFQESFLASLNGLLPDPNDLKRSVELYRTVVSELSSEERTIISSAFRNYLINDLIKNSALYTKSSNDALRALQAAVTRLSIFAIQLVGARAENHRCEIRDKLVLIISSTARAFEHNSAIMSNISDYLNTIEDNSIAVLGLLVPQV